MRACLLIVAIAVAGCDENNSKTAVCYPTAQNGWTFECTATGRGEAKADEKFSGQFIDQITAQGNDATRTFRGTRWQARVKVERGGAGIKHGTECTVYGTVTEIEGNTVRLTDCVFK